MAGRAAREEQQSLVVHGRRGRQPWVLSGLRLLRVSERPYLLEAAPFDRPPTGGGGGVAEGVGGDTCER